MTAVFRSCFPRFSSTTNQSISSEHLSHRTNSSTSLNEDTMDSISLATNQNLIQSKTTTDSQLPSSSNHELLTEETIEQKQYQQSNLCSVPKQTKVSGVTNNHTKVTKKRGPCYSRCNEQSQPLLTRLVDTIFGDHRHDDDKQNQVLITNKTHRSRSTKKAILPSKSTIKKQFEDNEQTLRSLVTLLTQIESNVKLTTTQISNENDQQKNLPTTEKEQARNNNRTDDTSSSRSTDSYQHKSKAKANHQHSTTSKRYTNTRSTKKYQNNKRKHSEEDTLSSSSITSHFLSHASPIIRRKMVDNQQQTQIYPTKINIGTSTQLNQTNASITTEPSWLDVMREDQTTTDAWTRIRRRLKPNQQKDILRALMIICANLFEVPLENKHT